MEYGCYLINLILLTSTKRRSASTLISTRLVEVKAYIMDFVREVLSNLWAHALQVNCHLRTVHKSTNSRP